MSIIYNGNTLSTVIFNGTTVNTVYFNGTLVYSAAVQTTAPTIPSFGYIFNSWQINITNQDSASATIRSEDNDSTPDIDRGFIGSGSTVTVSSSQPSFATFTHYATAQASGKTLSNVTSRTIT